MWKELQNEYARKVKIPHWKENQGKGATLVKKKNENYSRNF